MAYKHILKGLVKISLFILIGAIARVIPHAPNFTPIGAMALFGGVYLDKKEALVFPILAMAVSDIFLGFDSWAMRLSVYGSLLLIVLIGFWLKKRLNPKNLVISSLTASVLFFIITNFAVWAFGSLYPKTVFGLEQSYFFAIPFFRNTILGDLFFSGVFFGTYELIKSLTPKIIWQKSRH